MDPSALRYDFEHALLAMNRDEARRLLARVPGPPLAAIEALIVPSLARLGEGWERGQIALAQIYMGGRICEELVDTLLGSSQNERYGRPRMAIATIEDHHQLGKRIVSSALRGSGFQLIDYGVGTVDSIAARAVSDGIEILLLSALMLRSALRIRDVRTRLADRPIRVVVGGAPFIFDHALSREVGADAMATNAFHAVEVVRSLSQGSLPQGSLPQGAPWV
ncbi:MAG: cobalamin B12-binding domain-containing protein [Deltaproteobacteria bacterium]|nr:cobalamin B12-binding domain-containing protein [Deltaproteobacteria bacterium]